MVAIVMSRKYAREHEAMFTRRQQKQDLTRVRTNPERLYSLVVPSEQQHIAEGLDIILARLMQIRYRFFYITLYGNHIEMGARKRADSPPGNGLDDRIPKVSRQQSLKRGRQSIYYVPSEASAAAVTEPDPMTSFQLTNSSLCTDPSFRRLSRSSP
jgi:hypothetical protein